MSGVGEIKGGYYIVRGGGLPPRINVIGHTRRVNWPELIARLKAVSNSSGPVVEVMKEHMMKFFKYLSGSLVTAMMLVSCVTINIYFPAAAAEKAADRIIEDIWGPESEKSKANESEQHSYNIQPQNFIVTVLDWVYFTGCCLKLTSISVQMQSAPCNKK